MGRAGICFLPLIESMNRPNSDRLGDRAFSSQGVELPLSGVRVIEICQIAAGPFCAMMLGDLGADVIKIEPPGGDAMRQWPPIIDGFSGNFASVNKNKRSIALDLKTPDGLNTARQLIKSADVLLENNRPGVMRRLGLDYETVSEFNPSLIYCSISAFGQTGPRARQGAFDVTMQAMSGIMSVTGEEGEPPIKCGVPLSDFATGLFAAFHISSALFERKTTGNGVHIDASMLGCSLGIAALQVSEYFGTGKNPIRLGSRHPRNAPYQAFKASDGHFVLAAGNQNLFEIVCDVVDRPDLVVDPRFTSTELRTKNQSDLTEILESEFADETADCWYQRFMEAGVPTAPINRYGEVLDDPQVRSHGWVQPLELPGDSTTKTFSHPAMLSNRDLPVRLPPPALNEHEQEIMQEISEIADSVSKVST